MDFSTTTIDGVFVIGVETKTDGRGTFGRIFCSQEFRKHGLELPDRQSAISSNPAKATLRGLHFIEEAIGEAKLVRCLSGRIFDVAVDLRLGSQTFGKYVSCELSAENWKAIYLPRGVAHGFITLAENSSLLYQFSQPHRLGIEQGVRWDDPEIGIDWPLAPAVLSARDKGLPFLSELQI